MLLMAGGRAHLRVGQDEAGHGDDDEDGEGAHGGGDDQRAPDRAHEPEHGHAHLVHQEHDAPEDEEPAAQRMQALSTWPGPPKGLPNTNLDCIAPAWSPEVQRMLLIRSANAC